MNLLTLNYVFSFLDMFAVGLFVPLFSTHLREMGCTHVQIGMLQSIYSGIQIVSSPVFGCWSDIRGRKTVLITSLLFCIICYPLIGLCKTYQQLILVRIVLGITKHTQSLNRSIMSDTLPSNKRLGAYGAAAAYSAIGFIVGPLIAGHLAEALENGFKHICFLTAIVYAYVLYLIWDVDIKTRTITIEDAPLLKRVKSELKYSMFSIFTIDWSQYWDKFLIRFLYGFSVTIFFSSQSVYLKEYFQLSQRQIGYIVSYFSVAGAISAFLTEPIYNIIYPDVHPNVYSRLIHFFILQSLTFATLALTFNFTIMVLAITVLAVCSTILKILSMELFLLQVKRYHRGSLTGAANSIMSIARFVTPIPTGLIHDHFGTRVVVSVAVLPSLLGAFMCYKRQGVIREIVSASTDVSFDDNISDQVNTAFADLDHVAASINQGETTADFENINEEFSYDSSTNSESSSIPVE